MAGCDTEHEGPGDYDAGKGRVLGWVWGGAALGALLAYLNIAGGAAIVFSGGAALVALAAIAVAALAGAALGFWVGFAVNWFDRLHAQEPSRITMAGCVACAGKNTGFPPWNDNDWTFNLAELALLAPTDAGLDVAEVRERDAPGNGPAFATKDPGSGLSALHCEISSHIGDYAAVGGAVGAVAGGIAGALIGAAICAGLGIATLGLAIAVCALIVAALILAGVAAGGFVGDAIGAGVGWIADEWSDFDERGEAIEAGCIMSFTGRWVTDSSHQHNEIHDIESAQLIECRGGCGVGTGSGALVGAVGIGRHPQGRDP
jgi:hypothetical protein